MEDNLQQKQYKYAIIIALIALNLAVLVIKLLYVGGRIEIERAELAATIIRIGFIYLALTFIFRIFDRSFDIAYDRVPTVVHEDALTERDIALAGNVRKILSEEKLYRAMELSREMLAKKLAVTENQLSRVINKFFSQNFNSLINGYRVDEARARLENESTPVTTIAFEVGFNSIPSFNRVFKQVTGLSPSEYRGRAKVQLP
jgi:AraC-like DNA-binding protein